MLRLLHLFPGQGIQKVGMHNSLDLKQYLNLVQIVPGLQKAIEEGPQEVLNQTELAQPAIFISSYLRYQIQERKEQFAIGHSVGEYAALAIAGHLKAEDAVFLLHQRGCIMRDCSKGRSMGMLAVSSSEDFNVLIEQCRKRNQILEVAAYNSQKQVVYSGDKESLLSFQTELKKKRVISRFLDVSAAFHCSLLTSGKESLEKYLKKYLHFNENSQIKVIRNLDATEYQTQEGLIEGLREQLDHPVQFSKSVDQIRPFESIEYGSRVLTNLI